MRGCPAGSWIWDGDNRSISQDEIDVAKAKGALKVEVLATPAVHAAPADKAQDLWFGNFLLGVIRGFKYEDVNRDGKYAPGLWRSGAAPGGKKQSLSSRTRMASS